MGYCIFGECCYILTNQSEKALMIGLNLRPIPKYSFSIGMKFKLNVEQRMAVLEVGG